MLIDSIHTEKHYVNSCILFQEEMSAYAAVHMCHVIDACDRVRSIFLLPCMVQTSFVLVVLTRLNVSKPEH